MTSRAERDLKKLDRDIIARVVADLERYAETEEGDVKKLQGVKDRWRLRVAGDYRAIFGPEPNEILVRRIGHRREVYR